MITGHLQPGDWVARNNLHVGYVHLDDDTVVWNIITSNLSASRQYNRSRVERYQTWNINLNLFEELDFVLPHTIYEYYRDGKQIFP